MHRRAARGPSSLRSIAFAALALLSTISVVRAGVTIVDPAGGPGGALLQAAINTAPDGELLLLKPGDYTDANILVSNKLLSLVGDGDVASIVLRNVDLELPATTGMVLLRGLTLIDDSPYPTSAAAVHAEGHYGPTPEPDLWFEDCSAYGPQLEDKAWAADGFRLNEVFQSVLVRCKGVGGDGRDATAFTSASSGGSGLVLLGGETILDECDFLGGKGGDGSSIGLFPDGGRGAFIQGYAAIMGTRMQGGDEGVDNNPLTEPGNGLFMYQGIVGWTNSLRDSLVLAGQGPDGPAEDLVLSNGVPIRHPAPARSARLPAPLREGAQSALTLRGEVGDAVFIQFATQPTVLQLPGKQGAVALAEPFLGPVFAGVLPADGSLDVPFHVPELLMGTEGVVLFLQSFMLTAAGEAVTGSGTAFVWIDATL